MFTRKTTAQALSVLAATALLSTSGSAASSAETGATHDELLGNHTVAAEVTDEVLALIPQGMARNAMITENQVVRATEQYWSDDRMAAAKPMKATAADTPVSITADIDSVSVDEEVSIQRQKVVSEPANATYKLYPINPMPRNFWVNGKLFLTDSDGNDYTCSASAVNSTSKRLIATSADCLYDWSNDEYYKNVTFKGGYKHRNRPSLSFTASRLGTMKKFRKYGPSVRGNYSDIGFAAMRDNWRGMKVVEAVGGHGMIVGSKNYSTEIDFFAYASNWEGGKVQAHCTRWSSKITRTEDGRNYNFMKLPGCNFGSGSLGGPYLTRYRDTDGKGYLVAVNSFGETGEGNYDAAPLFRKSVEDKYDWVNEK